MGAVLPAKLQQMSRAKDAKQGIWAAVGPALDHVRVFGQQLLVATYIKPETTAGGIIIPDASKSEDLWQGSIGLVIKKGPWAFVNDEELKIDWKGQSVDVGEWVVFRYSSAWEQHLDGVSVRLIDDRDIKMVIDDPKWLTSKPLIVTE